VGNVVRNGNFYAGIRMKYFYITLFGLTLLHPAYAGAVDTELEYDEIRIGSIPSRSASYKGKPHTVLEAKSLAHHENTEIEEFFIAISDLASKGITDNATRFHEPTIYIEVVFQGESVRLFFSGDSHLEKYSLYEQSWKSLHKSIYEYLNKEISPNHRFNSKS
jgi:hypothetical protein